MTIADLVAELDAGLAVETSPDADGLLAIAQREGERQYTLYRWEPGGRLAFETFESFQHFERSATIAQ